MDVHGMLSPLFHLFAFGLVFVGSFAHADSPWKETGVQNSVRYEERAIDGSKFREYRATFIVTADLHAALEVVWSIVTAYPDGGHTNRSILRQGPRELLVYDRISTPVVSDRDLTLLIERDDGKFPQVHFHDRNELGPPPDAKYVRLPSVRGSWSVEALPSPTNAPQSRLTLVCYSEPGGTVPAFVVRGTQAKIAVHDAERVRSLLPAPR